MTLFYIVLCVSIVSTFALSLLVFFLFFRIKKQKESIAFLTVEKMENLAELSKLRESDNMANYQLKSYEKTISDLENELEKYKSKFEILSKDSGELRSLREIHESTAEELKNLRDKAFSLQRQLDEKLSDEKNYKSKIEDLQKIRETMMIDFKNMSNEILKTQTKDFSEKNIKDLSNLLNPFGENLESFKKRLELIKEANDKDKGKLEEQLNNLMKMNENLSNDAKDLTQALRGNKKLQGNWGETKLEELFQITDLSYEKQYNTINAEGNKVIPDFVVRLPNDDGRERKIIIDSKVSINSYLDAIEADNEKDKANFLKMHLDAIKKHIRELGSKNYQDSVDETLDYVFMYVPEPAYIEALNCDKNHTLYEEAQKNHVAIVTTSSLFPILKMVSYLWKVDGQNKNTEEIVKYGNILYDKLASFKIDMDSVGKALDKSKSCYNEAMKKLSEGSGNALITAEKMKRLGLNPKKKINLIEVKEEVIEEEEKE